MRIVFLSTNDNLGGAATVTMRLIEGLRSLGVDAQMVCARHTLKSAPHVRPVSRWRWLASFLGERLGIFLRNGLSRSRLFKVSTASVGWCSVTDMPEIKSADVIVINWVNQGLLSLADIDGLCSSGKPVIWIMHDLWCATGICHLPGTCTGFTGECGSCPLLGHEGKPRYARDLSHRVWLRKKGLYTRHPDLTFVAVSRWQSEVCSRSSLLRDRSIHLLPHAFPVDDYLTEPDDGQREALRTMGIDPDRLLIVMAAARLDDPVKDLPMAVESLNRFAGAYPSMASRVTAVFAGALRDPGLLDGLRVDHVATGPLSQSQLRALYAASAAVISTSDYETMGATLMEGIASGAAAVTFGNGGQRDIVSHGVNGYIARYKDADDFASRLHQALDRPFDRSALHHDMASRFSASAIATRFLDIVKALDASPSTSGKSL